MSFNPDTLRNTYFAMRHGVSTANTSGLIISDPNSGIKEYGLTEEGIQGVRISIQAAKEEIGLSESTMIFSSDFLRAFETAEIVQAELGVLEIGLSPNLRERFFGIFEGMSNTNYQKVWDADLAGAGLEKEEEVESVEEVANRVTTLLSEIEEKHSNQDILLVSHGDVINILQTMFQGLPPTEHSTMSSFHNAEIRCLTT
jgi:broad specificity phosphatase PhoE